MASHGDSYNGAVDEGFSWAQTLTELDITIALPSTITKGSQLKINMSKDNVLHVDIGTPANFSKTVYAVPSKLKLAYSVNRNSLSWSLQPGKCLQISLEKSEERWWNALCSDGRGQVADFDQLDAHQSYAQMTEDEKAVVRKLVEQQKQRWRYGENFQGEGEGDNAVGGDSNKY